MMDESVRHWLYSLGFLSSAAFTARFLVQWLKSEKEGRSVVPKIFWQLSITGNLLLCVHSWIQLQYHVGLISAGNAVIAWRNLNLMKPQNNQHSFKLALLVMGSALILTTLAFYWVSPNWEWFRVPMSFMHEDREIQTYWHFLGTLGLILFSSRFWVQWWNSEKQHQSQLNPLFWWLSLTGGALSLTYFAHMGDLVNTLGPAFGMVPYVRNLMLIYRKPFAVKS